MSNLAVMRSLRRRFNFCYNSPVFNKYCRSLRDFVVVSVLTVFTCILMLIAVALFTDDGRGIHSRCGTLECIEKCVLTPT